MKFKSLSIAASLAVLGTFSLAHVERVYAASASLTALDPDNDGTVE